MHYNVFQLELYAFRVKALRLGKKNAPIAAKTLLYGLPLEMNGLAELVCHLVLIVIWRPHAHKPVVALMAILYLISYFLVNGFAIKKKPEPLKGKTN